MNFGPAPTYKFNPQDYTITLEIEIEEDQIYYICKVEEFPNISAYEDTALKAYNLVIDAIETLRKIADSNLKANNLVIDAIETLRKIADSNLQEFPLPNLVLTNKQLVNEALCFPKYNFRTMQGIMLTTGLSSNCIKETLHANPEIYRTCDILNKDGQILYTSSKRKKKFKERLSIFLHYLKHI